MKIFPEELERRMARRALVTLCLLRRSIPTPKSDHVGAPSLSVVNLYTFALTVYVVSSSSSPSPSTSASLPWRPGDNVRASPSSCAPSVTGVSARDVDESASRDAGVDAAVGPEDAGGTGGKLKPKPELGAAAVCDEARDGEPKEKPTLPALGEGVPSLPRALPPAATPNTNCVGVAADAAEPKPPKGEGDALAGEPNVAPNTLLGGDVLSLSFSLSFSVDLAPNILPEPEELVSPKSFVPGGMLSANGAEANAVEPSLSLSFSFSFPSATDLSDPKSVDADFEGLPNSEVPEFGWLLLPKGEALRVVLVGADAPNENADFDCKTGSASFGVRDTAGLKAGDDDEDGPAANAPNGDAEAMGAGLVSEGAGGADGKLKGEEAAADAAMLGVKPVPGAGAAELAGADGAGKPAKVDGGTSVVAEVEVVGLPNENGAAELAGLLAALGALRVVDREDFPSYSFCTDIRCLLYCSTRSTTSTKGSDSMAFETAERKDVLSPRREV